MTEPFADIVDRAVLFIRLIIRGCLIVVATIGVIRGIAYYPFLLDHVPWLGGLDSLPPALDTLTAYIPLTAYALCWIISGLVAAIGAIKAVPESTFLVTGMCLVWAVAYTVSWIMGLAGHGPYNKDYVPASTYWGFCLLLIGGRYLAMWAARLIAVAAQLVPREET